MPDSRRVPVDTYSHRFECGCGWVSTVAVNGTATAGAELVRHMIDHAREEQE